MKAKTAVAQVILEVQRRFGCTCSGETRVYVCDVRGVPLEPDDEVGDGQVVVSWEHEETCPLYGGRSLAGRQPIRPRIPRPPV